MFKLIIIAVACFVALASSAHIKESEDVSGGMRSAFERGLEKFGGAVSERKDNYVPKPSAQSTKVFSHYTRNLNALGGGKPLLREQYRIHHFVPIAPSVVPREIQISDTEKITAEKAAKMYVPSAPLQYTNDILH